MQQQQIVSGGLRHIVSATRSSIGADAKCLGQLEVELRGLDIYDPATGDLRTASTDEIACWFIDTDYDAESFLVRHAYFTGADEPFDKLKRALRTEVDEGAWAALYRTVSRPFARPTEGRIAVKVIHHFGDEVLRTYDISANTVHGR